MQKYKQGKYLPYCFNKRMSGERREEYEFVKETNLDSIQGFYFGKPMEKAAVSELLKKN